MPTVFSHAVIGLTIATVGKAPAVLAVTLVRGPAWRGRRGALWLVLFLAAASHGILDAMTTGGSGVQAETPLLWLPAAVLAMVAAGLRDRRRGRG